MKQVSELGKLSCFAISQTVDVIMIGIFKTASV